MLKVSKIDMKVIEWDKTNLESRLEINLKGKNINHVILNSIKRTVQKSIPIYAFDKIRITKNSSVFNNNQMKLRIENLPIIGIKNDNDFFEEVEDEDEESEDEFDQEIGLQNIDLNTENKMESLTLNQFTLYANFKNESDDIVTMTTDDCKFYYKENNIKSPYKYPITIIKLHPKREFTMSAVSNLGIEKKNGKYSCVSIAGYKENNENDYNLFLESKGQIDEKRIIEVAIKNIMKELEDFISYVPENKGMEGKLKVPNFDHTLGILMADGLQNHSAVSFAGYNMPHPLEDTIFIHYNLNNGNLKKVLKDVINYYKTLFENLNKQIMKIK